MAMIAGSGIIFALVMICMMPVCVCPLQLHEYEMESTGYPFVPLPDSGEADAVYTKYPLELVSWVGYVVMGE